MKFSYNAVWDGTLALLRGHAPLVGAIAGVFIFLPSLLLGHFLPAPQPASADPQADVDLLMTYLGATWYWQLLAVVVTMVGDLAILILVLDHGRPTVGSAIAKAMKALPYFLLASFIVAVAMTLVAAIGVLLFGLLAAAAGPVIGSLGTIAVLVLLFYLSARALSVMSAVAAIEHRTPLDMIRRTWALTRRHGWAILGLVFLILLAGGTASLAISFVVGGIVRLALGTALADFLILLVGSAFNSALAAFLVLVTGSIYRELSEGESTASLFD